MLVVAGTIEFDPADQEAIVAVVQQVSTETRAEDGCISYEYFADITNKGRLHVFEEWEEEHHLLAHFDTPHFKAYAAELEAIGLRSRDITRYYVASHGPNRRS